MMRTKFFRAQSGNVLVEFAMILPLFLLIVWGVVDFGRALYTANSLAAAVREGGRVAAVKSYPLTTADRDSIRTRVTEAFNAFGGPAIPVDSIIVTDNTANGRVTVTVRNYNWSTSTPINLISGGKIKMTKTATFRWEREPTS
jgi:Flp pilus assembly protein TadG